MSNSSLVDYKKISPNKTKRTATIKKITIHHMAGNLTVEHCGNVFASSARQASSNYGIGTDGRIGLYVPENYRAWTSSSFANDNQAVTIEVANSKCGGTWPVSTKAYNTLIDLCVDICKRNGIKKLTYTGTSKGNLTCHFMFAATACPGTYLKARMTKIAAAVNARLNSTTESSFKSYKVKINATSLNVRSGAGTRYTAVDAVKKGTGHTVTAEKVVGDKIWGKISKGWIHLGYTTHQVKITADTLNIRKGPGTSYAKVKINGKFQQYKKNDACTISNLRKVGKSTWGKTSRGWICLTGYTKKA